MKNSLIFLFIPPFIKTFIFSNTDKISFLEFDSIDKKKLEKENEIRFLVNEEDNWQRIKEELNKENDSEKRIILINYPYPNSLEQFEKVKEFLLKESFLQKYIILVNLDNYNLIKEIREAYLLCPICETIHLRVKSKEDDGFFCSTKELSFKEEKVEIFNEQIINHYLENTTAVVKKLLESNSGRIISKTVGINITRLEELGNELHQRILSAISNIELDFVEN